MHRARDRRIFFSSSMRFTWVWSLPAVSTRSTSASRARAAWAASKATAPGSAPCRERTISAPARSAHTWSCATAPARKVSQAAIITLRSSPA